MAELEQEQKEQQTSSRLMQEYSKLLEENSSLSTVCQDLRSKLSLIQSQNQTYSWDWALLRLPVPDSGPWTSARWNVLGQHLHHAGPIPLAHCFLYLSSLLWSRVQSGSDPEENSWSSQWSFRDFLLFFLLTVKKLQISWWTAEAKTEETWALILPKLPHWTSWILYFSFSIFILWTFYSNKNYFVKPIKDKQNVFTK